MEVFQKLSPSQNCVQIVEDVLGSILLNRLRLTPRPAVKLASVMLAARSAGRDWSEALDYGMAMNTRGGPGIVVASIGLASGIIDNRMFTALVLASLVTSLAAGLWFRSRRDQMSRIHTDADDVP